MKKRIIALVAFLVLILPGVSQASFVSTLEFDGYFVYDVEGGLNFPSGDFDAPRLDTSPGAPVDEPNYVGVGVVDYSFDLDLPPFDQEYPWWLEVDLNVQGEKLSGNVLEEIDESYSDSFDLGVFSLEGALGMTEAEFYAAVGSIPSFGEEPGLGAYYIDGDLEGGTVYFALEDEYFGGAPFDQLEVDFIGQLTLTAYTEEDNGGGEDTNAVPEPATMALLGSGLIGLARFRKKS